MLSTLWTGDEFCTESSNLNIDQRAYEWAMFSSFLLERHKYTRLSRPGDKRCVFDGAQHLLGLKFAHTSVSLGHVKHDTPLSSNGPERAPMRMGLDSAISCQLCADNDEAEVTS